MLVSLVLLTTLMAFLFAFMIYNIVVYVVKQQRYKTFHIAWFYIFASCVVVLRLVNFSYLMVLLVNGYYAASIEDIDNQPFINVRGVDNYATFFELILGLQ